MITAAVAKFSLGCLLTVSAALLVYVTIIKSIVTDFGSEETLISIVNFVCRDASKIGGD